MADLMLPIGTPVEIEPAGQNSETPLRLAGRVADTSEIVLALSFVKPPPAALPLATGDQVEIRIALTEGIYRFVTPILERTEAGLKVAYPFDILRLQRRERRRVPAEGKVTFTPLEHAGARASIGALIDLSTGGLQLQTEKWLPPEAKLAVQFEVPRELRGEAQCVIRWKKAAGVNSAGVRIFNYGLQFVKIHERILYEIRQYILRREREAPR
jgi:c-di-GMP-binding flagellar brake protein YcgR